MGVERRAVRWLQACLFAAAFAFGSVQAAIVNWSGTGVSGTDPFGHAWVVNNDGGKLFFGIPGFGLGTATWSGPDALTSMTFTANAQLGLTVDPSPAPTGPGGFDTSTRFSNLGDFVLWDRSIAGNQVTFTAPDALAFLDPGQGFFFNIGFIGTTTAPFAFTVTYVTTGRFVPEPGGLALIALAGGVAALVRRRRA